MRNNLRVSAGHGRSSVLFLCLAGAISAPYSLALFVRQAKRDEILRQLLLHGWNVKQTAAALRMNRSTLYSVLHGLKIVRPSRAASPVVLALREIRAAAPKQAEDDDRAENYFRFGANGGEHESY